MYGSAFADQQNRSELARTPKANSKTSFCGGPLQIVVLECASEVETIFLRVCISFGDESYTLELPVIGLDRGLMSQSSAPSGVNDCDIRPSSSPCRAGIATLSRSTVSNCTDMPPRFGFLRYGFLSYGFRLNIARSRASCPDVQLYLYQALPNRVIPEDCPGAPPSPIPCPHDPGDHLSRYISNRTIIRICTVGRRAVGALDDAKLEFKPKPLPSVPVGTGTFNLEHSTLQTKKGEQSSQCVFAGSAFVLCGLDQPKCYGCN
jgi:hypothetical protein